jgi:hypothetical protein
VQGQISPARPRSPLPTEGLALAALAPASDAPLAALDPLSRNPLLFARVLVARSVAQVPLQGEPSGDHDQTSTKVGSLRRFATDRCGQRADLRFHEATVCYCVRVEYASPNRGRSTMEITLQDNRTINLLVRLSAIASKCVRVPFVADFGRSLIEEAENLRQASVAHRLELGDDERPRMLRDAAKAKLLRTVSVVVIQGRAEVAARLVREALTEHDASVFDNNLLKFLRREFRRPDLATQTLITLGRDLLDTIRTNGFANDWHDNLRLAVEGLEATESTVRTEVEEAALTMAQLKAARESCARAAKSCIKLIEFAGLQDLDYAPLTTEARTARSESDAARVAGDEKTVVDPGEIGVVDGAGEAGGVGRGGWSRVTGGGV